MLNKQTSKFLKLSLVLTLSIVLIFIASCRGGHRPDEDRDNRPGGQGSDQQETDQGVEKPDLPDQVRTQDQTEPRLKVYIADEGRVEEMAFEEYVAGVVGGEIKNDWPLEAIKAQAIIARTFVLHFIEEKGQSQHADAHVSTDIEEAQAWNVAAVNDQIKKAVNDTRGQTIVYDGNFARTWFHSNAGGKTATPTEGLNFQDEDPPYIQVVDSPDLTESVDEEAKSWSTTFTKAEVIAALKTAGEPVQDFNSVSISEKGLSGRALRISFDDSEVSAAELRLAIGTTDMRSTLIDNIALEGDRLLVSGKGYGHGVGMSQWGAYNMAENSKTAEDIINHYYKEIDIVKMWE